MNILGNRGYECDNKFISIIGSVNIDCVNKFIKEFNSLVNSSNYISIIMEDLDNYSGLKLKERLNTSEIYNTIYKKSFKNCLDINRILDSNGTFDKIRNYKAFYNDSFEYNQFIDKEFNLIIDYFNDYKVFLDEDKYSIHNISILNNKYNDLIKIKRR